MISWTELDPNLVEILETYPDTEGGFSLKIRHPDAGRPKIFLKSRSGNWYWVGQKHSKFNDIRDGYIIKDLLLVTSNEF